VPVNQLASIRRRRWGAAAVSFTTLVVAPWAGPRPARAESGALVVTSFSGEDRAGGKAMAVLQLQVWQTLRRPSAGGPTRTVYWDDTVSPTSHTEAAEIARVDEVPMTLWGRAWDYKPGLAIQAYLTLRADTDSSDVNEAVWTVAVPSGPGNDHRKIAVKMPARRYEFTPIVVKSSVVATVGELTRIPVYETRGSTSPVGALGGSFKAIEQNGDWAKIDTDGKIRWVHLRGLAGESAEITRFVGGLIRVLRRDWPGARVLLEALVQDPATRSSLRADAYLLLAAATAQQPESNVERAVELTRQALTTAPFSAVAVKYACMAHLAALARAKEDARSVHVRGIQDLLTSSHDLFTPADPWVADLRHVLENLEGQGDDRPALAR
jgi:hypothetical protein